MPGEQQRVEGRKGGDHPGLQPVPAHREHTQREGRKCDRGRPELPPPLAGRPVNYLRAEAEKRKKELRAPCLEREGGGLSPTRARAWGLGRQADGQGRGLPSIGPLLSICALLIQGWHCVSRRAGASPEERQGLSPERWVASAGRDSLPPAPGC